MHEAAVLATCGQEEVSLLKQRSSPMRMTVRNALKHLV